MAVTSAHELFGVDPAEFVAARDALARELKANDQREEAAVVKALRRPSVPTWALNRVASDAPDLVDTLLTATASARAVQERAIEGGADGDALRGALADRRAAVRDVLARAGEVAEASGRSAATQQRALETTLTAVIASDRLSELLRAGELVDVGGDEPDDDLASLLSASAPARSPAKTAPAQPKPKLSVVKKPPPSVPSRAESPEAAKAAADAAKRAVERRRDALRAVAAAERSARQAAAALDTARRKADAARTAEADAERARDAAVVALDDARKRLDAGDD